jgi:hypothetical protein
MFSTVLQAIQNTHNRARDTYDVEVLGIYNIEKPS